MPTTRENSALHALLQTQPAPVLRGEVLPERVPAAGLLILRDGDPGEPAVTLSPLCYHHQHRAEIEAVVQVGTGRDAAFDTLAAGVGTALSADRTLGGLCDGAEAEALQRPLPDGFAVDRGARRERGWLPGGAGQAARNCCFKSCSMRIAASRIRPLCSAAWPYLGGAWVRNLADAS